MPCSLFALDVGYVLKVSNHAKIEEVLILCPF